MLKKSISILLLTVCSSAMAGGVHENTWAKAYESYGYNKSFVVNFLNAVGKKDISKVYHLGAGTTVCNSKDSAQEFAKRGKYGSSYPGCFQVYYRKIVAYQVATIKNVTKYRFIMTMQPAWRNRFFDNKVGSFAVYEGWTPNSLLEENKQQWDVFVKRDIREFNERKKTIRNINNMPDENGVYPVY